MTAPRPGQPPSTVDRADRVDPRNPKVRMAALFDAGSFTDHHRRGRQRHARRRRPDRRRPGRRVRVRPDRAGRRDGRRPAARSILAAYERALADGCPVIGLWHSGGARLREGVLSLHAVGEVFAIMTRASGRIPQISVVLGAAAGGAAYGPALTDIVIMGPAGRVFVTGPDVVRSVTGEDVDMERLGGPEPHGRRSGVVHVITDTEAEALGRGPRRRVAARRSRARSATVEDADLGGLLPESARSARTTCTRSSAGLLDEGTGDRAARAVGAEHRHHARPARRPHRRRRRQQPAAPRRLPRLGVRREGRPVRADVRRVRRAAGRARRRARLPARRRPRSGRASSAAAPSCCTRSPSASCRG